LVYSNRRNKPHNRKACPFDGTEEAGFLLNRLEFEIKGVGFQIKPAEFQIKPAEFQIKPVGMLIKPIRFSINRMGFGKKTMIYYSNEQTTFSVLLG